MRNHLRRRPDRAVDGFAVDRADHEHFVAGFDGCEDREVPARSRSHVHAIGHFEQARRGERGRRGGGRRVTLALVAGRGHVARVVAGDIAGVDAEQHGAGTEADHDDDEEEHRERETAPHPARRSRWRSKEATVGPAPSSRSRGRCQFGAFAVGHGRPSRHDDHTHGPRGSPGRAGAPLGSLLKSAPKCAETLPNAFASPPRWRQDKGAGVQGQKFSRPRARTVRWA